MEPENQIDKTHAVPILSFRTIVLGMVWGSPGFLIAQGDSSKHFQTSIYLETYYTYDLNKPAGHVRPPFFYSYNRHNEVNINLGFIKVDYNQDRVRASMALMAGTYANTNLAAEPGVLKNIFEANVGLKLAAGSNIWLDAGVMPSHIGFESAIGQSCWNMTRSMLADNSPYYETGARLSYADKAEKWYLSALYLNGWQHIQRPPGVQTPAFGTQIRYQPHSKAVLNWSTFAGNEFPDSVRRWRYFHNVYGILQVSAHVGITAGLDFGMQQRTKHSSAYDAWYSTVVIVRVSPTDKLAFAGRAEYYDDQQEVIISTSTTGGFQTTGFSINADYNVTPNFLWRVEARGLQSRFPIFRPAGTSSYRNFFVSTSLAITI